MNDQYKFYDLNSSNKSLEFKCIIVTFMIVSWKRKRDDMMVSIESRMKPQGIIRNKRATKAGYKGVIVQYQYENITANHTTLEKKHYTKDIDTLGQS